MMWISTSLEFLSTFGPQYGANARAVAASGTRPRYVRITDIDSNGHLIPSGNVEADIEDESEFLLQEGDLLFARSGNTVGKTYRYSSNDGPCIFAGYLIRVRIDPTLADSQFVFYFTQSPAYQSWVLGKRRVAGQPNINGKEYASLQLLLPPISEQRRIVEILDQADALRRKRAEADAKAARILPALFYKMFGDPATNPKGWPLKPFDGVIEDCTARFPKLQKNEYQTAGRFPVVDQGKELVAGYSDDETLVTAIGHPVIVFGDHTRIVKYVDFPFIAGADGSRVFVTREGFVPAFMAMHLEIQHIPNLGYSRHMREVRRLQFIGPPTSLQEKYESLARNVRPFLNKQAHSFSRIESIWQTLLQYAFTGDLTAKWREAHMKELLAEMQAQAKALEVKA